MYGVSVVFLFSFFGEASKVSRCLLYVQWVCKEGREGGREGWWFCSVLYSTMLYCNISQKKGGVEPFSQSIQSRSDQITLQHIDRQDLLDGPDNHTYVLERRRRRRTTLPVNRSR